VKLEFDKMAMRHAFAIEDKNVSLSAVFTPTPDGGFIAWDPDTNTRTQGDTLDEAFQNLREAVDLYLEEFPKRTVQQNSASTFVIDESETEYSCRSVDSSIGLTYHAEGETQAEALEEMLTNMIGDHGLAWTGGRVAVSSRDDECETFLDLVIKCTEHPDGQINVDAQFSDVEANV
jgi:predicted RNase H-like HicB family nuclease